ncbi:PIN2/TERF1-interacting telomerase inhibitor 1 [Dinochytrium kinnereticum]|nr:PIN2/TERF1-interacting telomerase inhibitor 1 [Dinochytrium kinnereticum]
MGLAGPRNRQRISADPQNQKWAADTEKAGYKMLRAMGWSDGKGLGRNEDGMASHLKVSLKNNTLGVGAQKNASDNWLENTNAFSALLANLNKPASDDEGSEKDSESDEEGDEEEEMKDGETKKKKNKRKAGEEVKKEVKKKVKKEKKEVVVVDEEEYVPRPQRMLGNGRVANRRRHLVPQSKPHEADAIHKILGVKKRPAPDVTPPRSASPSPPPKSSDQTVHTGVAIDDYFASKLREKGITAASVLPKAVSADDDDDEGRPRGGLGLGFSMGKGDDEPSPAPAAVKKPLWSLRVGGGFGFVKAEEKNADSGMGYERSAGLGFVKAEAGAGAAGGFEEEPLKKRKRDEEGVDEKREEDGEGEKRKKNKKKKSKEVVVEDAVEEAVEVVDEAEGEKKKKKKKKKTKPLSGAEEDVASETADEPVSEKKKKTKSAADDSVVEDGETPTKKRSKKERKTVDVPGDAGAEDIGKSSEKEERGEEKVVNKGKRAKRDKWGNKLE